jgi:hypothetical protein
LWRGRAPSIWQWDWGIRHINQTIIIGIKLKYIYRDRHHRKPKKRENVCLAPYKKLFSQKDTKRCNKLH